MAVRYQALSLGAQGNAYLAEKEWLASVSYRYLHSFRDFTGSQEVPVPAPPNLEANTTIHSFDVAATYAATKRFNVSLTIPFIYTDRKSKIEHDGKTYHPSAVR